MQENFYRKDKEAVLKEFNANPQDGLSESAVKSIRDNYGYNDLKEKAGRNVFSIIFDQLKEVMVFILIIAAVVSFFMHEVMDAAVILIIVVLNTALGSWQEFKAEKAMAALKRMAQPNARVRRDKTEKAVPARELVPGDIIIIESGDMIGADSRIIDSFNLKVQEASLTGESEPVEKISDTLDNDNITLAERKNMLYMGTIATYGRAEAVVVSTGMHTQLGNIAAMLQGVEDEKTPFAAVRVE